MVADSNIGPAGASAGEPLERKRGEFRIYLGAAPGVGKTYAMLGEAHRRQGRGADVVVGIVETHGRAGTRTLLDGLEIIPRRVVAHRGAEFGQLDVDAVLARRPEVVLVDDLAHTNVPGSANAKRWQDVEEILDAGIDVLSTMNVQHLQSLNDVVERITGTVQLETVPDEVVRAAGQIELVDIAPEELRRRLAHGQIYPADKVDAALSNYFRTGNLTALRELALLWVADEVDVALRRYREEHQITEPWEARERVVVAVTGGPESETLIRRARRIASKSAADLRVVHVLRSSGLPEPAPDILARCRAIAEDVGATFHTVVGEDVPTALLDFAHGVNATQLVLGTSRRSRPARLIDEGIGTTTVRNSGGIDVHIVTHDEASGRRRMSWRPRIRPARPSAWSLALLLPAVVVALGVPFRAESSPAGCAMAFVLAIVVTALVGGLGPALLAAAFSGLSLAYFFLPPLYSVGVASPEDLIALVIMIAVAVVVSLVVDRAARLGELAARARAEAALLGSYARSVLAHPRPLKPLLDKVRENFGLISVTLMEKQGGAWQRLASSGTAPDTRRPDAEVPIAPDVRLALHGRTLPASDRRMLETAAGHALLALRHQRMADEADQAKRQAGATEVRTALLSALGHDLRTPLTSIRAAADGLRDPAFPPSETDAAELLETIQESTARLSALVENLLGASRLATGAVRPLTEPVAYDEVVANVLSGVDDVGAVEVTLPPGLPLVLGDPELLERVLANLVDNALRYGVPPPERAATGLPGPAVAIRVSAHLGRVELRVVDHGNGLPANPERSPYQPFQRFGDRDTTTGAGLGLSVAKGFTEAMGGTLSAEETPGGGLTMVVSLPAYHEVPGLP